MKGQNPKKVTFEERAHISPIINCRDVLSSYCTWTLWCTGLWIEVPVVEYMITYVLCVHTLKLFKIFYLIGYSLPDC